MVLFCAAFRRDSVSLLMSSFLSHIKALSCENSLVSHLKYPYNCFSYHFCFLVIVVLLSVLFLVAAISLSLLIFMYSLCRHIDESTLLSMLACPLSSSFPDSYSLSMSSLRCKALCIVIFLVLWSIC